MLFFLPESYVKQAEELALIYSEAFRQAGEKIPGVTTDPGIPTGVTSEYNKHTPGGDKP